MIIIIVVIIIVIITTVAQASYLERETYGLINCPFYSVFTPMKISQSYFWRFQVITREFFSSE